ncbi:MAG: NAD-dependent epimerase/dehydratase family protein [Acidobacteriota bacterium]
MKVLVTGAAGYLGGHLLERLEARPDLDVLATDLRRPAAGANPRLAFQTLDLTDVDAIRARVADFKPEVVVHLAAVVDPEAPRELAHAVDVAGTLHLADACLRNGVRRLVVTSSGAAYGYRPDHPRWIEEDQPLAAGEAFAYAWHKRRVEEDLAELRHRHPELEQVVLRPGTVLGAGVSTPVTRLFEGRAVLGIRGGDDRFVFIWDRDAAGALERAVDVGPPGVYNLAGDGALSLADIARRLGVRHLRLPAAPVAAALAVGRVLRLTGHGPEQVRFLRYRPVLSNRRLKEEFGFVPTKTSAEAFDVYLKGLL